MKSELFDKYKKEVVPAMEAAFGIENIMAVPRLDKIVVNMGVGEAMTDIKILEVAASDLAAITGQKPTIRRSKNVISYFHFREYAPFCCKVTLRRQRMYDFMERLINVVLPRIRDFNGISRKSFDREGNYSLGLKEQSIFPEIDPTRRDFRAQGMDITFVINGGDPKKNLEMLSLMGMPFTKQ